MEEYKKGNFSRHVEGEEELPPPDPKNLGRLPNKRYYYHPPRVYQRPFIGHTIGMGQGSLGGAAPSSSAPEDAVEGAAYEEYDEEMGGFERYCSGLLRGHRLGYTNLW